MKSSAPSKALNASGKDGFLRVFIALNTVGVETARRGFTSTASSCGRLEIGLGTGLVSDPSYDMIGIPDWEPKERVARLERALETNVWPTPVDHERDR